MKNNDNINLANPQLQSIAYISAFIIRSETGESHLVQLLWNLFNMRVFFYFFNTIYTIVKVHILLVNKGIVRYINTVYE